jgi:hypothetical protein
VSVTAGLSGASTHEAWQQSALNQREYCEAPGIPLKAFGNPHNLSLAPEDGQSQVRPADEFAQTVLLVIRAIQAAGTTSFASIADVLNERGIKSARGGKWHVSSVANVLSRTPG